MSHKLSLSSAILINLNIMVGAGIFINTVLLSKNAGGLGGFAYTAIGLLIFPLVLTIYQLAKIKKGGNFYEYGMLLHPYAAFLATASYFIAKLASCALAIHVCVCLLQTIFPTLAALSTLALDCGVITLFALLNMMNLRTGKHIQLFFISCKFVPILFVIFSGIYLFNSHNFSPDFLYPEGIITSAPFLLYAFTGFEASSSLSRSLQNPEKNAPRALILAYSMGVGIVSLFQFLFYASVGAGFNTLSTYLEAYPALVALMHLSPETNMTLKILLHLGIASSALGAAYGIMYSNAWNIYELALRKHTIGAGLLTKFNVHGIPYVCVALEAGIAIVYLLASWGNQVPLQQISALGSALAYTICTLALTFYTYRVRGNFTIPVFGLISCMLLIGSLSASALSYGIMPLAIFGLIMLGMSLMYRKTRIIAHN